MKKLAVLLVALCIVLPTGALAQNLPGAGGRPGSGRDPGLKLPKRSKRRPMSESQRVLHKPVAQIEWEDTTLEEIFEWVNEQGKATVVVRWRALEEEGVEPDTMVNLKLRDTTVGRALAEALDQVSENDPVLVRGIRSMIKISTRSDFNRKLYVRVYPIDHLLLTVPDFTDAPRVDLTQQSSGGGGGGGGGDTEPIFSDDDSGDDIDEQEEVARRIEDLILLIEGTIEPDTWLVNGGEGTIAVFNKQLLIVRNSIEVHEKLGGPFEFD